MNSIRFLRIVVVVGSLGLVSPLIAQSGSGGAGPLSSQPGSGGPITGGASSAGTSGGPASQSNQGSSAESPNHYGSDTSSSTEILPERSSRRGGGNGAERAFKVDERKVRAGATDGKFQGSLFDLGVKSMNEVKSPLGQTNALAVANDKSDSEKKRKATAAVPQEKSAAAPSPAASASPATKSGTNH